MNDYISRQAVLDLIYELQNFYENEGNESEDFNSKMMYVGSINALTAMEDGLSDIPAADVRPAVYGEWEEIRDPYGKIEGWICKCGSESRIKSDFCPYCGADMRGKKEENQC